MTKKFKVLITADAGKCISLNDRACAAICPNRAVVLDAPDKDTAEAQAILQARESPNLFPKDSFTNHRVLETTEVKSSGPPSK